MEISKLDKLYAWLERIQEYKEIAKENIKMEGGLSWFMEIVQYEKRIKKLIRIELVKDRRKNV